MKTFSPITIYRGADGKLLEGEEGSRRRRRVTGYYYYFIITWRWEMDLDGSRLIKTPMGVRCYLPHIYYYILTEV